MIISYGTPYDYVRHVRRLAAAILEVAVNDLSGCPTALNGAHYKDAAARRQHEKGFRNRAYEWINSDRCLGDFGSFLWCCDRCDLDPGAVRERLNSGRFKKVHRALTDLPDSSKAKKKINRQAKAAKFA